MNKILRKEIWSKKLPITLLFMENVSTKNTIKKVIITIKYEHGEKIITNDFYKHISTY